MAGGVDTDDRASIRMTGVESAIDDVLAGRLEAYAEVVRLHQDGIRRIVAFTLRDVAATEDLVQQVFVNAYMKLDTFERGRDLGAWLRSIARNLVRNELRRSARERKKLRTYGERLAARLGDPGGPGRDGAAGRAAGRRVEGHGHEERLRDALAGCREKLSPNAKRALELRYARSLGFSEIAGALGRTVAATRQLLSRTRLALRRCIEERTARS